MKHGMIEYATRDLGHGDHDSGQGEAYVTDQVDWTGKRTILLSEDGNNFVRLYLFSDEWRFIEIEDDRNHGDGEREPNTRDDWEKE